MKFYRFIADIQLFGNFFMRKVLNTAHYKNFSGTFWQKIQSVIDYFLCFSRKNFIRFTSFSKVAIRVFSSHWACSYNCSDTSLITVLC